MNELLAYDQIVILIIGSLVPLIGYWLNNKLPWVSESAKAIFQVVLAAAAGAVYTALEGPNFGWNADTLNLVVTAVVAALGAHGFLWKPGKFNTKLGATETTPVRE
jgi:peptidoglycan/LPS O-acetylase OafA/YrhL